MSIEQGAIEESSPSRKLDPYILLFSLTLFLSASLTFTIQPMVGKMLLPLVGGAPSGWLVTMVYFQLALLAGYAIAHALSRMPVTRHIMAIIVLLLIGLIAFPLQLHAHIIESYGLPEAFGVLLALTAGLTIPCVALFTLSPSLQRLFDSGSSGTRRDPYFLFAASNVGSLGGLLAYPIVIERISGLFVQTHVWQAAYIMLIALCTFCLLTSWRQAQKMPAPTFESVPAGQPIDWAKRRKWILFAFIPSSLMIGVTSYVTSDLGGAPFFWVLPLALYLLTFILAFAQRQKASLSSIRFLQLVSVAVMITFFIRYPGLSSDITMMVFPMATFLCTALFCHYSLAASRPDARYLTEFYLWVAVGGALGGIFNNFIAPFIFPLPVEFALVTLLSCLIHQEEPSPKMKPYIGFASVAAIGATVFYCMMNAQNAQPALLNNLVIFVLFGSLFVVTASPRWLAKLSLCLVVFSLFFLNLSHIRDVHRDFFGVLRVYDVRTKDNTLRILAHGTTMHGLEQIAPQIATKPNGYYDYKGPLGDLFNLYKPMNIGIVGMGVGTTVCYQTPGRHFTIYEIDPAVPEFADKWFDYMKTCGEPKPKIIIGDGRRKLTTETDGHYDLITIDAFTSDMIPVHLLTKEAFQLYFDKLNPNGVLAIHISNHFYDLGQPISNLVSSLGLHALYKNYTPPPEDILSLHSRWVVIARDAAALEPLRQHSWTDLPAPKGEAWTDDFSDVISALVIVPYQSTPPHAQAN